MKPIIANRFNWPKDKKKQPLFTSTNDALLYAQFIHADKVAKSLLLIARQDTLIKLRHERIREQPSPQRMMDLAVKAQLYRECLQECQRIQDEQPST